MSWRRVINLKTQSVQAIVSVQHVDPHSNDHRNDECVLVRAMQNNDLETRKAAGEKTTRHRAHLSKS